MPLCTTGHHNLTLNRRLATLASWTKEFMEIEMTVKPQCFISIIMFRLPRLILHEMTCDTRSNPGNTL
jgi:hypothetical protein